MGLHLFIFTLFAMLLFPKRKVSNIYSKTCLKGPLKKRPKISFQDRLSLNAGQKYCRMLQGEHSAILMTFIKQPLSLRPLFCLFLSGCLRQVLLLSVSVKHQNKIAVNS